MSVRRWARPRPTLRWRVAITFGLVFVGVGAVVAGITWQLASGYMLDQRAQRAQLEASVAAGRLAAAIGEAESRSPADAESLESLLAQVATEPDSTIMLGDGDNWVIAGRSVDPERLPAALREDVSSVRWEVTQLDGRTLMVVALPSTAMAGATYLQVSELVEYDQISRYLLVVLVAGVVASGILGVGIGWWVSRRALRPLLTLTDAAERVAAGDLTARLPDQDDPDLDALAATFNSTVEKLERRVVQDTRFAGDVSHELRTPLTTMVNAIEVLRHRRDTFGPQAQQAVDLLGDEVDRFRAMVVDLLEISRADDQDTDADDTELVDLGELTHRVAATIPGSPVPEVSSPPPIVRGDRRRLVRVLANLLDNAARHGGGAVRVAVGRRDRYARVEVDDRGPGVPPEFRGHVFERFARIRPADRSEEPGTGLGLALVARHVGRHHGTVWVEDGPGGGARFVVELPCLP